MKPHAHHIERPLTAGGVCYPPYRYTRGYAVLMACESWDQGVYGHPRAPTGARVLPSPTRGGEASWKYPIGGGGDASHVRQRV